MRRNSPSEVPVDWAMSAMSERMRSTVSASVGGEGGPFLVGAGDLAEPILVELVPGIGVEEGLARDAVALGEAKHLAAERHQPPVVGVKRVDQGLDLRIVELDALDLGGELLAELVVFLLLGRREVLARLERVHPVRLDLAELLEDRGDLGEFLERLRL